MNWALWSIVFGSWNLSNTLSVSRCSPLLLLLPPPPPENHLISSVPWGCLASHLYKILTRLVLFCSKTTNNDKIIIISTTPIEHDDIDLLPMTEILINLSRMTMMTRTMNPMRTMKIWNPEPDSCVRRTSAIFGTTCKNRQRKSASKRKSSPRSVTSYCSRKSTPVVPSPRSRTKTSSSWNENSASISKPTKPFKKPCGKLVASSPRSPTVTSR